MIFDYIDFDGRERKIHLPIVEDKFNVNYKTWKEDDYLSGSELELGEMFTELVFKCWSKVKKESGSKMFGMLSYATGGGGCFNLDSKEMSTESKGYIKDYYEKKGMMLLK
ncbi:MULTISPECIES: hypothetical protein [unclassified Tenacibaculum]|uniref:hypothetical protein n=1 Tax=unclassified Tenacibaculum TaxID=2635139 RepID=UPI001F3DF2FB|nr:MULTISPECIES: hypothetical protein [unclassified Tenacibaculum]MCF2875357.1 hypothetical protein [Tenacibaculum sp. Cn5-1]MCF2935433.1 hypothetical protein [Tenacibaculum sp. Cn5-34]MCG7511993.1 hypothetical protein [Tenacibaculum sp. Cn5-46]